MIRPAVLCLLIATLLVSVSHAVPPGTGTALDDLTPAATTAAEKKALAEFNAQAERDRLAREANEVKIKELERKHDAENARLKDAEAVSEDKRRKAEAAVAAKKQAEQKAADQLAVEQAKRASDDALAKAAAERDRLASEAAARTPTPGQVMQDCPECPKMVVIPAGNFTMGSPDKETGHDANGNEGPQHLVRVESFLMGQTEVTNAQFRRFTQAKGYQTEAESNVDGSGCYATDANENKWDWRTGRSWRKPGWNIKDNEPVACVSWNDARAYVDWLSQLTRKTYQLPTEAQWEYAARAGTTSSRYWGDDPSQACLYANVADQTRRSMWSSWRYMHECKDGYLYVAPVATFKPNAFGLYDMLGNQWEWTQDCFNSDEYKRRKASGEWLATKSSDEKAGCWRVVRGGSWASYDVYVRSAIRGNGLPGGGVDYMGFRIARALLP